MESLTASWQRADALATTAKQESQSGRERRRASRVAAGSASRASESDAGNGELPFPDLKLTVDERSRFAFSLEHKIDDLFRSDSFVRVRFSAFSLASLHNMAAAATQSVLRQMQATLSVLEEQQAVAAFFASERERSDLRTKWLYHKAELGELYGGYAYLNSTFFSGLVVFGAALVYLIVQNPTGNYDSERIAALVASQYVQQRVRELADEFAHYARSEIDAKVRPQRFDLPAMQRLRARRLRLCEMFFQNCVRYFRNDHISALAATAISRRSQTIADNVVDAGLPSQAPLRSAMGVGKARTRKQRSKERPPTRGKVAKKKRKKE